MTERREVDSLRNLGPKSRAMLAQAGIHSIADLRQLGSVKAYVQVKQTGVNASLNLLWALEGALAGVDWRQVAKYQRVELLQALKEYARML